MPGFLHRLSGKFQISRKIRTQNFKIQTQTIQTNTQIHILEDFGSINNSVMCRTLPTSVNSLWSASTKGLVQKLVVVLLSFNPPPAIRFLTCPCLLHWRPPWLLAVECLWFQYWGKPEHSERGTSKTCTRARTHTHTHAHAHTHTHTHIHTHTRTHARTHARTHTHAHTHTHTHARTHARTHCGCINGDAWVCCLEQQNIVNNMATLQRTQIMLDQNSFERTMMNCPFSCSGVDLKQLLDYYTISTLCWNYKWYFY